MSFHIPKYQRGYEWEDEHIDDFWKDLEETDSNEENRHFFGTIYTSPDKENQNIIKIVDGQQRITSCALFLLAARDFFFTKKDESKDAEQNFDELQRILFKWNDAQQKPDETDFILNLSRTNKYFFNRYIVPKSKIGEKSKIIEHATNDSNEKLSRSFLHLLELINTKFGQDQNGISNLNHMVFSLIDKFEMINVEVGDEMQAYDMFNLINNRGTRLAESDLIKNRIFSQLEKELSSYTDKEERLDEYDQHWTDLRDNITGQNTSDYNFDNFLHHYLVAFKFPDVKLKEIFKKMQDLLKKSKADEIIDNMFEWSRIFIKIRTPSGHFSDYPRLEYYLTQIKNVNSIILYPVVLSGYHYYWEQGDKKSFAKLIEICFKYFIRSKTIGHNSATPLETKMHSISKLVADKKPLNEIIKELLKEPLYQTNDVIKAMLQDYAVSNRYVAKYLLEEIEHEFDKEKTSGIDVTIEHIMPRSITKWLDYIKEKHNITGREADNEAKLLHLKYKNWLGNQTLLSDPKNKKNSNKPFDEKKIKYAKDGYKITQMLANEDEWTVNEIKKRQSLFVDKLINILNIEQYLEK